MNACIGSSTRGFGFEDEQELLCHVNRWRRTQRYGALARELTGSHDIASSGPVVVRAQRDPNAAIPRTRATVRPSTRRPEWRPPHARLPH